MVCLLPGNHLHQFLGLHKELHSHLHQRAWSMGYLLMERVPQVQPQVVTVFVSVLEPKIVLLQQANRFAGLRKVQCNHENCWLKSVNQFMTNHYQEPLCQPVCLSLSRLVTSIIVVNTEATYDLGREVMVYIYTSHLVAGSINVRTTKFKADKIITSKCSWKAHNDPSLSTSYGE